MLQEAHAAVPRIMRLARELGGVGSGQHGIDLAKYKFLPPKDLAPFHAYKERLDPEGRFHQGKLMPGADLSRAYTPSFSLRRDLRLVFNLFLVSRDPELPEKQ